MIDKLSSMLDAIADSLESKGLMKEAAEVDVVANTIDRYHKRPLTGIHDDLMDYDRNVATLRVKNPAVFKKIEADRERHDNYMAMMNEPSKGRWTDERNGTVYMHTGKQDAQNFQEELKSFGIMTEIVP